MIQKDINILRRGRTRAKGKRGEGPVIYWMERDQRLIDNWALLYAQQEAIIRQKPLHIVFFLEPEVANWTCVQRDFMLSGLGETVRSAPQFNLGFSIIRGKAGDLLPFLVHQTDSNLLVTDFSPLRAKKAYLQKLFSSVTIPVIEVDSHNIIPAWTVSAKKEYAAYTIRPKINRLLSDYLTDFIQLHKHPYDPVSIDTTDIDDITDTFGTKISSAKNSFAPGSKAAAAHLKQFISDGLDQYAEMRNNPNICGQSELSCYFHFGQLSPQRAAFEVKKSNASEEGKSAYLEELIVRRELSDNFCLYEDQYDSTASFSEWALKTLNEHRKDRREYQYTLDQLERGETHEQLWNSCQKQLVEKNKLHGFLRMYWAKKILEWTESPEHALDYCIYLNDTYSIDGRDPNGFAGAAWSIGGVHDRAWQERKVFGKIRYMNERGCRRKFNVDEFIASMDKKRDD